MSSQLRFIPGCCALLAALALPVAAVEVITTVAGNGANSDNRDGIAATSASLLGLEEGSVFVDSGGNIFFTDSIRNVVRKVDAATGLVATIAGDGTGGFSGDGGAATAAKLSSPGGLFVDSGGNLYFADTGNQRIRKVSGGIITTVVGDGFQAGCDFGRYNGDGITALSASLNEPKGVVVDGSGNIFIADTGNGRVRKVEAATGMISTVAGNGTPGFGGDGGAATLAQIDVEAIALDTSGNIFIGASSVVRMVAAATGIITTVAGTGSFGFAGDGGPATAAQLSDVRGVVVDGSGNIYIGDRDNNRIRKVDAGTGNISTVAGNGAAAFSGDGGPAVSAALSEPASVALDSSGNLYIQDRSNARIRKVTAADGNIFTVAGNGSGALSGDDGPATAAALNIPTGIALDSAGNVYVADQINHRIRKITPGGVISTVAGTTKGFSGDGGLAASAQLKYPNDVAVDSTGNLFIADTENARVRRVDAASGIITTVAGTGVSGFSGDGGPAVNAELEEPTGLALDGSGNLYIVDQSSNRVRKISGGTITTIAGNGNITGPLGDGGPATSASLCEPQAISVDPATGDLFIADTFNYRIRKVDAGGTITTFAGNGTKGFSGDGGPALSASLGQVSGLAFAGGALFLTDSSNNRIRKIDASGVITTIAGTGAFGFSGDGGNALSAALAYPIDIAAGSTGLFVTDTANNRIRKIRANTPPAIQSVTISQDPIKVNTDVTFTANASDADSDPLSFAWNLSDGRTGTGNPLTISFAIEGSYTGTLTVSDGFETAGGSTALTVVAPPSTAIGVKNVSDDPNKPPVTNPLNGIAVKVSSSEGGVVELAVNIDAINRQAFEASTDFSDIAGRVATGVRGLRPVHQYTRTGVFVATSKAIEVATGQEKGKARKTLAISRKETGQEQVVTGEPSSHEIVSKSLKGKFLFTKSGDKGKDLVSYSGKIKLPAGYDTTKVNEFAVGLGNVVDTTVVDPKGRGTLPGSEGRIKKLKVKYPKLSGLATGTEEAQVDVTISTADMDALGFDTEGVTADAKDIPDAKTAANRSIQVAIVLAGVSYETFSQVQYKVSAKRDAGQLLPSRTAR